MTYEIVAEAYGSTITVSGDEPGEVVEMFHEMVDRDSVDFPAFKAAERMEEIDQ